MSKWGSDTNRSETGVGHAEELSYIFKKDHNFAISETEQKIRKFMCKMWTNMAHTGYELDTFVTTSLFVLYITEIHQ